MKIRIVGKQMDVSDELKELVAKKLKKFDRFFNDSAEAVVTFNRRHNQECLEITISANGTLYRSEEKNETFNNALDECIESIERQIRKNKTRLEKRLRAGAFDAMDIKYFDVEEEKEFRIRTKTFPFKPITPEEAILQMNLLGHQFFVFVDAQTEDTCVVYRRLDGDYGMIVPEK
jgi:putative sigma-54 modulation protein